MSVAIPLLMAGCANPDQPTSYPRTSAYGENMVIDYGLGPRSNIVGGGAIALQSGGGENFSVRHLDRSRAQLPMAGMVPFVQQGENTEITWIPGSPRPSVAR